MIKAKDLGSRGEPLTVEMTVFDLLSLIDDCTVAHLHLFEAQQKANARSGAEIGDTLYSGRAQDAKANVEELDRILIARNEIVDAQNKAEDEERAARYAASRA